MAATEGDDDVPWTAQPSRRRQETPITDPLPTDLELVLGDQIYIAEQDLPPALRNRLIRLALDGVGCEAGSRMPLGKVHWFAWQALFIGFRSVSVVQSIV
jgi:hypothetical protein